MKVVDLMHDEFFKYNLKKKQILNGTLKSALPENIFNMIDLEKTESEKTDFITDDLKQHQSDVLLKTTIEYQI